MLKKLFFSASVFGLLLAGCSDAEEQSSKQEEVTESEQVESNETSNNEESKQSEKEQKEEELEARTAIPETKLTKRDLVIYENEKGSITYLGDSLDDPGTMQVALKYTGDINFAEEGRVFLRLIYDNGDDQYISSSDILGWQKDGEDEIVFLTTSKSVGFDRQLKRIDYGLVEEEGQNRLSETEKTSFVVEETSETVTVKPSYYLEKTEFELNTVLEDDQKTIKLNDLLVDATGIITVTGEITFKEDYEDGISSDFYRPITRNLVQGTIEGTNEDFFAGIADDFTITYETDEPFYENNGTEIYIEVEDKVLPFDLKTGKPIEGEIPFTEAFNKDTKEIYGPSNFNPVEGFKTTDGDIVYPSFVFQNPNINDGIGTEEFFRNTYNLGGNFKKFTFKLASGEELAGKGGVYDIYFYADAPEFEDKDPSTAIFHHQMKGTDKSKEFTVNVENVNQLQIFIDSNKIVDSGLGSDADPNEKLIQVLVVDPTLK